ncbi:MAG: Hsp20/alpha crystallin family protein [Nitrospirae bacterium]|nr:Hsp20/alpha crystallin family protein [Nitrospirota bacterium]MBF0319909.1 Hsp20/alpha crystallin family protein [Nitrospirota bacterium]
MFLRERANNLFHHDAEGDLTSRRAFTWIPPFDIFEMETEIIVKADIPGVIIDDISVVVEDNNILTIKGERKPGRHSDREYFHCMERSFGRFMRSFKLPGTADIDSIVVVLADGVLSVSIPKNWL